jgi:hypothetical protein
VGKNNAFYAVLMFVKIGYIGNNHINAQHIVIRKCQTAIHYDKVTAVLKDCHIFSDLMQSSKGRNLYFFTFLHKISSVSVKNNRSYNNPKLPPELFAADIVPQKCGICKKFC